MTIVQIIGVDPGIVDTGCVRLHIDTIDRTITTSYGVIDGLDEDAVWGWSKEQQPTARVFVERYEPRLKLNSDVRMTAFQTRLRRTLPRAEFISNVGSKAIVKPGVMQLLGLWKFGTGTHHQDLKAAARIALLGMIKDEVLNRILADIVKDAIDGEPWTIVDMGGGRVRP